MESASETTEARGHGGVTGHPDVTGQIIGCAIEFHRALGPGLLESAYQKCMCREFGLRGIVFESEVALGLSYKGLNLENVYRIDLVVESLVAVELKTVTQILPVHRAQTLTYLRLSGLRVGLILNFYTPRLIDGVERLVL